VPTKKKLKPSSASLVAQFSVESAILEELGERLVNSADVALVELVKNSYDADAAACLVEIGTETIVVSDNGNGMSTEDFLQLWMVIGTRNKAKHRFSQKYQRKVSGSKGIGRFAARFLGSKVTLVTTVLEDAIYKTLTATFDWDSLTQFEDLQQIKVPYELSESGTEPKWRTVLTITKLRQKLDLKTAKKISSDLLSIVNPIEGFEKPQFGKSKYKSSRLDPGFNPKIAVNLSGSASEEVVPVSPVELVLNAYFARVRIEVSLVGRVSIALFWERNEQPVFVCESSLLKMFKIGSLGTPALIDIRFFPNRAGVFKNLGIDGMDAKQWVRDNYGVKIVDNGFQVKPFGSSDDDWLMLSADKAKSARKWRSKFMAKRFPIAPATTELENPMLYLPRDGQLCGMVSVMSSAQTATSKPEAATVRPIQVEDIDDETTDFLTNWGDNVLTPSMDRQGFVNNQAFFALQRLARIGVELIAHHDHKAVQDSRAVIESETLKEAEEDLKSAFKEIQSSTTIAPEEKVRLGELIKSASTNYKEVDVYRKKTQESLEVMSLMGVLAGFMTHEFEKTLYSLSQSIKIIKKLKKSHPELASDYEALEKSQKYLETYLDYSRTFIEGLSQSKVTHFKVAPQIEMVLQTLAPIADANRITFQVEVDKELEGPKVPIAAYSGILLNLVTNGMKALIARSDRGDKVVRIVATSNASTHRLLVADSGIGIPTRLRGRIWEPLFTTTSRDNGSLGTGMGLGLALVQRVVKNLRGKIELLDEPPAKFSTAFCVELPAHE
jgi:signal transduction histidine kinase